jgi:hypothetical protein
LLRILVLIFCAVFLALVTPGYENYDFGMQKPYAARLAIDEFEIVSGVDYAVSQNTPAGILYCQIAQI